MEETSTPSGIGAAVPRVEDRRLLTGQGQFSDDISRPGQLYAVMVRSPHAHAELLGIDAEAAQIMPGVRAVLTGADWKHDGLNPMPAWGNPKDVELRNRDGSEIFYTPLYPVAIDRIRRAGEIVAVVVAETMAQARDAAEAVGIEAKPLEAVVDGVAALADDAPGLWQEVPGNLSVDDEKGNEEACARVFRQASHIVRLETFNQRVTGVPMEPRAALAEYDPETGHFLLETGGQGVIRFRNELATTFGIENDHLRVISRDVGGGYGTRNHTYPEFALVLWAAKRMACPVKWVCERSEAFLSDYAGRDLVTRAELALDQDGTFLALRTENIGNIGTHTISYVPLARGPTVYNGVYDIPVCHAISKAVLSNTTATASYRGAGRPESMFVIERLIDMAALETGIDRTALRRRNMIPETALPYTNAFNVTYDSGDFATSMARAMALIDWEGFPARKQAARDEGRVIGIGLANYIETATGYPQERAEMEILPEGRVNLVLGTQSSGQGHQTTFAQVVSQWLGVPFDAVVLRTGDTDFVLAGSGSHSSRSMRLAGHLYRQTTDQIIERGRKIAAFVLDASPGDVTFEDGRFAIPGTNRSLHLFEAAEAAVGGELPDDLSGALSAVAEISTSLPTYPNGCHAAEVEIDNETGEVSILRYVGVDDVGRVINPLIVDGQTQGGIVQGIGQALAEECVYDRGSAQLLTGSFMDYCMPRADDVPSFVLEFNEVPAPNSFLGVKGGGEGGTTAAPPALINAIVDALSDYGVSHIDMPATPQKIWRLIKQAHCSQRLPGTRGTRRV
jgi:carbon-monoxide dehydrogenase large subunit